MPGKAVLQSRRQLALDLERDAAALPLGQDAGPNEHELEIQELVESEPSPASLCLVHRGGPVHRDEGISKRQQVEGASLLLRKGIIGQRDQSVEMSLDEGTDDLVAESLGRGVDWEHLARSYRVAIAFGVGENDVLPGSQLPPVVETYGAGHQERLAHGNSPVQKRLPRPDAFQQTALIPQHRM